MLSSSETAVPAMDKAMTTTTSIKRSPPTLLPQLAVEDQPRVFVHSTFRSYDTGRALRPRGLEWDVDGDSHVRFVVPPSSCFTSEGEEENGENGNSMFDLAHALVQAYNRWCSAKDLPYKTEEDILAITPHGPYHYQVEWKAIENRATGMPLERVMVRDNKHLQDMLWGHVQKANDRNQKSKTHNNHETTVWINGVLAGTIPHYDDPMSSIQALLEKVPFANSNNKWRFQLSSWDQLHIDRCYTSFLRKNQAWDHVWDNLVALEDPQIIDDHTLIGTATLADWIMGGELTSRLWVRDDGHRILFLRPLYDDDIESADRRYEIKVTSSSSSSSCSSDEQEQKMKLVRGELARLRFLANLSHPYAQDLISDLKAKREHKQEENNKKEIVSREQANMEGISQEEIMETIFE